MNDQGRYDPSLHARRSLELPDLLALVARYCLNEGARRRIHDLRPVSDPVWICDRLSEIEEVRSILSEGADIPIPDTSLLASITLPLSEGRSLGTAELRSLAELERAMSSLAAFSKERKEDAPRLYGLVSRIEVHGELIREIDKAVGPDGELLDDASSKLSTLRRRLKKTREALRSRAQAMASKYGENSYATVIDGRFNLLVPRSAYRRKQGIVHGTSQSGESVYFEPMELVERNNELQSTLQEEMREQARILEQLTALVASCREGIEGNVAIAERIDSIRAKARFAEAFRCISPARNLESKMRLVGARHPLLILSIEGSGGDGKGGKGGVVPLDLELGPEQPVLVITGPNAGGKTVALKTVGLLSLMHQCGLQIPCEEGTDLPVFSRIFADIGDEQSIGSSLSTFTSHLRHLDAMTRLADTRSLCLIDEIGDGTDPEEGAALANALLDALLDVGAMVVVTTHYGKVKVHAMGTEGIGNGSMLFDEESGRPLYRLVQGVAGRSRGMAAARLFGFSEKILRKAEEYLGEEGMRLEGLLEELESSRVALEREREDLKRRSEELRHVMTLCMEREERLRILEERHDEIARREAEELLSRARREVEKIVKEIRESGARRDEVRRGHERLRSLLSEVRKRPKEEPRPVPLEAIGPGAVVSLSPSGRPSGKVVSVKNGVATVEMDGKRIKIDIKKLHIAVEGEGEKTQDFSYDVEFQPLDSSTLDVRGLEREEALVEVDRFLDLAILNGLREVGIVHGVGEGVLLRAIRERLASDPRVASWRPGRPSEGGEGVSIVVLS